MESRLSQNLLDDLSMNVGEPLLTPAKSIRQLLVIQSEQMKNSSV